MKVHSSTNGDSVYRQNYFFGQKLKELRKKKKISQERLAHELGVTRATVANYETGRASPPFWLVERVACYFKIELTELNQEGEGDKNNENFAS